MSAGADNGINGDSQGFTPPYGSFKTMLNLFSRMDEGGLPSRIDRSYLSNLPGSTQSQTLAGMRALGMIDANDHPTDVLKVIVANPAERSERIGDLVRQHYMPALDLGLNATQGQLEEVFSSMGVTGSTRRKAIAFFLAAAKFSEVEVSPNFKIPKVTQSNGGRRRRKGSSPENEPPLPPPPSPDQPEGLHPFIQGLVRELPKAGAAWPTSKREAWTRTALATFDLIYEIPDDERGGPDS